MGSSTWTGACDSCWDSFIFWKITPEMLQVWTLNRNWTSSRRSTPSGTTKRTWRTTVATISVQPESCSAERSWSHFSTSMQPGLSCQLSSHQKTFLFRQTTGGAAVQSVRIQFCPKTKGLSSRITARQPHWFDPPIGKWRHSWKCTSCFFISNHSVLLVVLDFWSDGVGATAWRRMSYSLGCFSLIFGHARCDSDTLTFGRVGPLDFRNETRKGTFSH